MKLQKLSEIHAYEIEFSNSIFRFRSPIQQLYYYNFANRKYYFFFGRSSKFIGDTFYHAWEITILGFTFGSCNPK